MKQGTDKLTYFCSEGGESGWINRNGAFAQNKETLKDKTEVIVDQRVVSTMFLPSAALVAKEMIGLRK